MDHDIDVLVVGNGPVGLMALTMLGRAGLSAVGIDRDAAPWPQARAVHFDDEVLRIMQSIGLGEEVGALCSPMRDYRFLNESGEEIVHHQFGLVGPQGWPLASLFHQPDIDGLLRRQAIDSPGVQLRPGMTLLDLQQHPGGVLSRVRAADGAEHTLASRWVIGADGAHSTVRKLLGIDTENLGSDDPWVVVDGVLRGPAPIEGDMVVLGRHSRPGLWLSLPRGRARLELKLLPGDDRDEIVSTDGIARVSGGWLTPDTFACDRAAVYTFRSRLATQWRKGNAFLAGDAAHQAPPLFGQGLCAGLRDVANLVWKLRLVAAGAAEESLLDTYESERLPHARYWVEKATAMAAFAQTTDPAVAAQRDGYLRSVPDGGVPPAPPLGLGLHRRAAGEHSPDEHSPVGLLAPQPMLEDGHLLDDLVGWRFLIAGQAELLAELEPALLSHLGADPDLTVLSDPAAVDQLLGRLGARAVIVRPDRYVLGIAEDATQLRELIDLLPISAARRSHSVIA